jgi:hypothetical protein
MSSRRATKAVGGQKKEKRAFARALSLVPTAAAPSAKRRKKGDHNDAHQHKHTHEHKQLPFQFCACEFDQLWGFLSSSSLLLEKNVYARILSFVHPLPSYSDFSLGKPNEILKHFQCSTCHAVVYTPNVDFFQLQCACSPLDRHRLSCRKCVNQQLGRFTTFNDIFCCDGCGPCCQTCKPLEHEMFEVSGMCV